MTPVCYVVNWTIPINPELVDSKKLCFSICTNSIEEAICIFENEHSRLLAVHSDNISVIRDTALFQSEYSSNLSIEYKLIMIALLLTHYNKANIRHLLESIVPIKEPIYYMIFMNNPPIICHPINE